MRISDVRTGLVWMTTIGYLMSKVMAARFVTKLQNKKVAISQWITTTRQGLYAVSYAGTATIALLGGTGLTSTHLLG